MDWYYVDGGKQAGPVNDTELEQLLAVGKIQGSTLVWHEGMANWLPYGQVNPARAATLIAEPPPPAIGSLPEQSTAPTGNEVVCVQCNRMFPKEETIQYGSAYVCATCKPAFVQKLKEGAVTPTYLGAMDYAGFWIRFGAFLIDWLILLVVNFGLGLVMGVGFTAWRTGFQPRDVSKVAVVASIEFAIRLAYGILFVGKFGGTPGKLAVGVRVVDPDGAPVGYGRATGRYFARWINYFVCLLSFIMVAFDEQKRGLHDHIANTRVIRVR